MPYLKFFIFCCLLPFFFLFHITGPPLPVHFSHYLSSSYTDLIHSTSRFTTKALRTPLQSSHSHTLPFAVLQLLCRCYPHSLLRLLVTVTRWRLPCMQIFLFCSSVFFVLSLSCCQGFQGSRSLSLSFSHTLFFDSSIRTAPGHVTSEAWQNSCLTRRRPLPPNCSIFVATFWIDLYDVLTGCWWENLESQEGKGGGEGG
jgi:hypothetical protein